MLSHNVPNVLFYFFFSFVNCHLNYNIQLKNNYLNISNWSQKIKRAYTKFSFQIIRSMAMALKEIYRRYILNPTLPGPSLY